jgi:prolyl-tRNA synthetase
MKIIKKIYEIWEGALEEKGHEPVLFPVVIPPENFEMEKEHVEGFTPEVFWVTEAGGDKLTVKLALRPTSETAFYQMYNLWIRSYTDLPLKSYQSCAVYRHETKATKPLVRGREFLWIEAHDAFATEKEAREQVAQDMEITKKVLYDALGIPFIFFKRPSWDKFKGAEETYAADSLMPDGKLLQLPSTHYFAQRFSKPFDIKFEDSDGNKKYVHTTSYGPPIWRTVAALVMVHGDDRGLVLPFAVAPVQVVIVPILYKGKEKAVAEKCKKIVDVLGREGIRVKLDDSDKNPGEKYYYWEMKGVPIRLEIGPRDVSEGVVVAVRRDTGSKEKVKDEKLAERLTEIADDTLKNLRERAEKRMMGSIKKAATLKEIEKIVETGIAKVNFCSTDATGEACAEKIKEIGGEVRGTWFGKDDDVNPLGSSPTTNVSRNNDGVNPKGCVVCGKKAKCVVYVGRAY